MITMDASALGSKSKPSFEAQVAPFPSSPLLLLSPLL